jgi:3-polyprenyl-4-hydroxybenzoate decarboxylase
LQRVTVVDVDIRDHTHVDWALDSRFSPQRDTVVIDDCYVPITMNPSVRDACGNVTPGSKLLLEATQKIDSGLFSLPLRNLMMKALDVWKDCGVPELQIPKRAKLRVEQS